jgi:Methyltransferase domain
VDSGVHWDSAYKQGDTTRSWYQDEPIASLRMFDAAQVSPVDSVIDVGGGASTLVDALLGRGFSDISVLDVSVHGLAAAQNRLGDVASPVEWIVADVLAWRPSRSYSVWHDRAVFHFLTDEQARQRYIENLQTATEPGAVAIIGCFALDGPQACSGLPVARYDAAGLAEQLGRAWALEHSDRYQHTTPAGAVQPFTWAQFRRQG